MSLDVYLTTIETKEIGSVIFRAENGDEQEFGFNELIETYPEFPVTEIDFEKTRFESNITHNLNAMAGEANLYDALWRPEEIGITVAKQLITPLTEGLDRLKSEPDRYKAFNPENGWGDYDGLCSFVQEYLDACNKFPLASVRAWR